MERSPSAVPIDLEAPATVVVRQETPSPGRLETFSDAVFSVIITLLVLDLRVPRADALPSGQLAAALVREWPVYIAFVISFLQVGVVWANHHTMFHHIRRTDHLLLVLNLLLLLSTAVLPFTTALLSEYVRGTPDQQRLAARIYSGALMASGVFFNAVWQHALTAGLVNPHANPHHLYALRRHWLLIPVLYGIALLLTFVDVRVSDMMYLVLLFYYATPGPSVIRWITARQARHAVDESVARNSNSGRYR